MKRLFVLIPLLLFGLALFAQVDDLPPTPGSIWEAIGQFSYLVGSFPGVVVLMFFFVPFVLGGLNIQGKFFKYLLTVLVVTVLVLGAYFFSFGYLHGAHWWVIPVNVGLLLLIQIGGFAFPFIKDIQDKIYEKWNPWKPIG
jgi:hypothetical protein